MLLIRRLWGHASLYLPLALVGFFAAGSYWLVNNSPARESTLNYKAASHKPDYYMRAFSVKTVDEKGLLKSVVFGDYLNHYPDTDLLEIDGLRIEKYKTAGLFTLATARRGLITADGLDVQLFGDARVVRPGFVNERGIRSPELSYQSEFLHAFLDQDIITSHLPVTLMRGSDIFKADRLNFNNLKKTLLLEGRIQATIK